MEEKNEFILYLYQACEMGVSSTKELLNLLNTKENKIKGLLSDELKEYEDFYIEIKDIMEEDTIEEKSGSLMAKIGSFFGIRMDMMMDNSDAKIADMLIQGYTMGVLEVTKKMKQFKKSLSKREKDLGNRLIKMQNKNIKELKKYL